MAQTTQEPLGKVEQMLVDMIDGQPIVESPDDKIQGLLMELAQVIAEGGGGGGGGIDHYSQLPDKPLINGHVLSGDKSSEQLGLQSQLSWDEAPTENSQKPVKSGGIFDALAKKVTSETGKGLSSNDYTTEEKTKLAGLSNYDDTALAGRVTANETAISGKADTDDVIDSATYDSTNHQILFKNGTTTLFSLDAAAFVKDGMVDDVEISGGNLVITFNTDAGKQDISIPLTDIFDPANYYDKTVTDNLLADKADDTSVYKTFSFGNTGSGGGTVKYIELTDTYPNSTAKENSYMITGRNGESAILVLPTGMTIGVYNDPRLLYLTRGTSTPIVSVNLDSTNGKVYVGIGLYTYVHISQIGGERTNWSGKIITELPSGATTVAIVSDVANKADKVANSTNGNFAGLDANGNLTDSGIPAVIIPSGASASNKLATIADIGGRQLPLIDLGTSYSEELKEDISSGKFEKAVVGGYLTINGHVYYLAHPDYWLHTGDTECTTHHMLVIPAEGIGIGKMNNTNITTGAYAGSDMKTGNNSNTALATAAAQIKADFGASNILTHRELFANAVTDGKVSGWAWADSDIDLMNEVMVYGCNAWASHPGYETGIDKCQIKLFQERPDLITNRALWWLRSVVSAANFALVRGTGEADSSDASRSRGVRPAFAIC